MWKAQKTGQLGSLGCQAFFDLLHCAYAFIQWRYWVFGLFACFNKFLMSANHKMRGCKLEARILLGVSCPHAHTATVALQCFFVPDGSCRSDHLPYLYLSVKLSVQLFEFAFVAGAAQERLRCACRNEPISRLVGLIGCRYSFSLLNLSQMSKALSEMMTSAFLRDGIGGEIVIVSAVSRTPSLSIAMKTTLSPLHGHDSLPLASTVSLYKNLFLSLRKLADFRVSVF